MFSQNTNNRNVSELHEELMNKEPIDTFNTIVWVDFNKLNEIERKDYSNIEIEQGKNHDLSNKALMYLQSSMDKDERMFKLENGINKNEIKSISDAKDLLNIERATIINYLKELDKTLLDDSGKEVGSTEAFKLSESKQFGKSSKAKRKNLRPQFRYFDGEPYNGGKEITKNQHAQRIHEFKSKKLEILEEKRNNL